MKIFFLDIDGVISTRGCWGKGKNNKWDAYMFDPKCVAVLNYILIATGAEIILSSDWRHHYTLQEIREIFCHNGVIKGPIGFTPALPTNAMDLEGGRSNEIKLWLKLHAWKDDLKWVAVDDMNMHEKFDEHGEVITGLKNFVHCPNDQAGIKGHGVKDKILEFLS